MAKIKIINTCRGIKLPSKKLKNLVKQIIFEENLKFTEINIVFVDDDKIWEINKQFLNHDYPTDVISFDLSDDEISGLDKVAEIYISVDRAIQQSKFYKVSFENEIARLTAHGLLHLAGYDDKMRGEKLKMRRRENYYMERAGF